MIRKFNSSWTYIAALVIIFFISFSYIFNSKIDLNGDNCEYYMLSTSIVKGHGYSNISNIDQTPSGTYPPGYPLIMSSVRIFTDSPIPQKIMNGIFLLISSALIFFFIRECKFPNSLAFIVSASILLNANILHFTTMMMSEMSYMLFTIITLWALYKLSDKNPFFKDPYFYILVFATAYAYHIRTQGIALIVAVACFLFVIKKWKEMLGYISGIALCLLPWMIRNSVTGVGSSRYLNQIFAVNNRRPEEGIMSIGEVALRFLDTFRMLITKAIPNSIIPYFDVDYTTPTSFREWCIALIIIAIIGVGFWQFKKLKYFFILYTLATLSLISIFNDPSENRYITTLLPFLEIGVFIGLYVILTQITVKLKIAKSFSPWIFTLFFVFFSFPKLKAEHIQNKLPFPPNYQNYFTIAEQIRKDLPSDVVVCSRKPGLFYLFSQTYVSNYKWTDDDVQLIQGLIDSKVDYVVLDQLGYSSTPRYLYPALVEHQDLFNLVMHLPNPDTYLLKFDRESAIKKLRI